MTSHVSNEKILNVFLDQDVAVLSTKGVSDELDIEPRQTLNRLNSLEELGEITSKIVGRNTKVWIKSDSINNWTDTWPEIGVSAIDMLDVAGKGRELKKRRQAIDAVFRYLFVSSGPEFRGSDDYVKPDTLKRVAKMTSPEVSYDSLQSFWNNCIRIAINDSIFFDNNSAKNEGYSLSMIGSIMLDVGGTEALWQNWNVNRQRCINRFSREVEPSIKKAISNAENAKLLNKNAEDDYIVQLDGVEVDIILGQKIPKTVWVGDHIELYVKYEKTNGYSTDQSNPGEEISFCQNEPDSGKYMLEMSINITQTELQSRHYPTYVKNQEWMINAFEHIRSGFS